MLGEGVKTYVGHHTMDSNVITEKRKSMIVIEYQDHKEWIENSTDNKIGIPTMFLNRPQMNFKKVKEEEGCTINSKKVKQEG